MRTSTTWNLHALDPKRTGASDRDRSSHEVGRRREFDFRMDVAWKRSWMGTWFGGLRSQEDVRVEPESIGRRVICILGAFASFDRVPSNEKVRARRKAFQRDGKGFCIDPRPILFSSKANRSRRTMDGEYTCTTDETFRGAWRKDMSTLEGPSEVASFLAEDYLERTRAYEPWQEGKCVPRYLWTDAFAVCLLLGLDWKGIAFDGKEKTAKGSARDLVRSVHGILGRKRMDEKGSFVETSAILESTGWLSDDRNRPTARGLRIGKRFPERKLHEEYDEDLEWDRDGQYFHYLTKWAHALSQLSAATTDSKYVVQAAELVKGIHWDFARGEPGARHLAWKMSTDLSRALVPTQGHADPLDGFVTYLHIQATLTYFGLETKHSLEGEIEDVYTMVIGKRFDTNDFLGIGCLLSDAAKLMQLCVRRIGTREKEVEARIPKLLLSVLEDADHGLERLKAASFLLPAEQRLAFREFGLSIGLQAVPLMLRVLSHIEAAPRKSKIGDQDLRRIHSMLSHMLKSHYWMVDSIHVFWKEAKHRRCRSWASHRDINEVMWATSLVPDGHLEMLF